MTRIKYTTVHLSKVTEWLPVGPNLLLQAHIFPGFTFCIINTEHTRLYEGSASSLRAAKSKVRAKLIEYGLKLEDEIRRRNTP